MHKSMMSEMYNQETIINRFVEWYNHEYGSNYVIQCSPDKTNRNNKDVDYILIDSINTNKLAVEVSTIWDSSDSAREDSNFGYFIKCSNEIWNELIRKRNKRDLLGSYNITIEGSFFVKHPKEEDIEETIKHIYSFISNNWHDERMRNGSFMRVETERFGAVDINLLIGLYDKISFSRYRPIEANKHEQHLKRIVVKKFDQLNKYSSQADTKTCLLLYQTNWMKEDKPDVFNCIAKVLRDTQKHIDEIYLIRGGLPDDCWVERYREWVNREFQRHHEK